MEDFDLSKFTDEDIYKLDEIFAKEKIPFHARPLRAAQRILGTAFSISSLNNSSAKEITDAYKRLIPEVEIWPGDGIGLIASVDQVKKVIIPVVYGTVEINIPESLGFTNEELWQNWCRNNQQIQTNSIFAFADLLDISRGISAATNIRAKEFWALAASQLEFLAESLSQSSLPNSSALQPICLATELAMKGTLLELGISETDLKKYGHNLQKLYTEMVNKVSHRDDPLLLKLIPNFPHYVNDRYQETNFTRLEIIEFALATQFIVASSIRRISKIDFASEIEKDYSRT